MTDEVVQEILNAIKKCTICKIDKSATFQEFSPNLRVKSGLRSSCRDCERNRKKLWWKNNKDRILTYNKKLYRENKEKVIKQVKQWAKDNPEKIRNNKLKHNFGITLDQYNKLLQTQNGCCAICNAHESNFNKKLAVDHCHITKKIRGLLCSNCNIAIGKLKGDKNTDLLKNAIKYLEKSNG